MLPYPHQLATTGAVADQGFIRLRDAGDLLAMDERSIRRYIAQGKLPGYRIGGRHLRVRYEDVVALAARVPSVDPAA